MLVIHCFSIIVTLAVSYKSIAQEIMIKEVEGAIIYPETDSIPQEVIFIPSGFLEIKDNAPGIWLYFQGIRWNQRNLKEVLTVAQKKDVKIQGLTFPPLGFIPPGIVKSKMIFGTISFNTALSKHLLPNSSPAVYSFILIIDDQTLNINYREASKDLGLPVNFKPLDL